MTKKKTTKKAAARVELKTSKNNASVSSYLNSIEPLSLRKDGKALAKLFKMVLNTKPKMWGNSIVGYGEYTYKLASGKEGLMLVAGFSMRKSGPVVYNMPDSKSAVDLMQRLGKHKLGKSCLYIKNLDDVDLDVLSELIMLGVVDTKRKHDVKI